MRNILLTISYDGTNFCGWQRQDHSANLKPVRTVQSEIEAALEKLHTSRRIILHGSGRTDSGVHAAAQAANFFSPIDSIPVNNYIPALNAMLPHDVRIIGAREVHENFDARFSATSRVYRYYIAEEEIPLANQMPYVWFIHRKPDISALNEMAACLLGETDYAAFAASGDKSVSTKRYVERAAFSYSSAFPSGNFLMFEIEANAFLWKMVRSIVGTLIEFERDGKDALFLKKVLESGDRSMAGVTAPSRGLFLWQIKFDGVRRHV
ncbi:tRNA pseudouridine(38-40) synthase TruA [Treponema parvum]|uniref:tRNA pseudouridine synthase A n=1 Tax=Treponema parvum TaxID=138851 RepID=A0A975EZD8_9SPIR|nr:tRNA pseudouridine(38-40) synthase TruA [Treponema parvum]QTQ11689.1 tRNA pseudouridine(38-40) synthase TruA [Treponema parvum]